MSIFQAGRYIWHYFRSAKATHDVAKEVANLLRASGAHPSKIHLIGFSLGAHVVGFTGNLFNGEIGRVTGLDPAGPGFSSSRPRLSKSAGRFVDVMHTAGLPTSILLPMGHADFYPNNLRFEMPGCSKDKGIYEGQSCSHFRAVEYYIESIGRPTSFLAKLVLLRIFRSALV